SSKACGSRSISTKRSSSTPRIPSDGMRRSMRSGSIRCRSSARGSPTLELAESSPERSVRDTEGRARVLQAPALAHRGLDMRTLELRAGVAKHLNLVDRRRKRRATRRAVGRRVRLDEAVEQLHARFTKRGSDRVVLRSERSKLVHFER